MKRIWQENGLSITLFALFVVALAAQFFTGRAVYNDDRLGHGHRQVGYVEYLSTGHFVESVFENWESEFLQMAMFVLLTIFLYQKGSAQSKEPPTSSSPDDDKELRTASSPSAYRLLYENSLSIALTVLFGISFAMHAVGGVMEHNEEALNHGQKQIQSTLQYISTSQFWFESFQNWQSEFLSIGAMVVLTIFLRQAGSAESKPV